MHQYLFFIGDFPVRSYGLILSLSIVLATVTAYFLAKQDGRWHHHIPDMGIYCGLAGIVGARLWDVFFFDWDYYQDHLLEIPFVWQGGMAIQGGVVLGAIVGYLYTKKHKIDTWAFADIVAAPAVIMGQAIGRMANLMNGDAFGQPTGSDFGIIYPSTTLAHQIYGNQPLWPAEIWEGQIDVIIFVLLLLLRVTNHAKGQVFVAYAVLYSAARFFLEFLRGDYGTLAFGLKSAQLTSLTVMIIGIGIFIWLGLYGSRINEPAVKTPARQKK
ncbi:prolipoprotein diacylglyceryl transferase [Acetonema longum]|uniref:Phosphatidylglycerol--prolipoprotein diacylglyceryl transferase n=1 Tax=Acetonema longum DSM 6540 TaxID=1009370 RepID=F7NNJ7_9FIRM|nr:prolipoprotein diacylglyceryl transferase [Acetonema longum]EGO62438.1 prolipoprotein diacylglyceryl transferase [Acetonema longum DSM 6540]